MSTAQCSVEWIRDANELICNGDLFINPATPYLDPALIATAFGTGFAVFTMPFVASYGIIAVVNFIRGNQRF